MLFVRYLACLCCVLWLSACSSNSSALMDTLKQANPFAKPPSVRLLPRYSYLRTVVSGRVLYLVLGYVDARPEGDLETWYSASGEVIRLLNGRIFSTAGLATDWRAVRAPSVPAWTSLAATAATEATQAPAKPVGPWRYARERDAMPGYRFGIQEQVEIKVAPVPSTSQLDGVRADSLLWFQEQTMGPGAEALPLARYGVEVQAGQAKVIYSEQCLSAQLCFSFQHLPEVAP